MPTALVRANEAHDDAAEFGAQFHDAFVAALQPGAGTPAAAAVARLASQPGFAVYRNTVRTGSIDALCTNYPALERMVGSDWLRAAAAEYVEQHPPRHATLLDYGDTFAAFLEHFAPARDLPYLPAVARVDRLWMQAHTAADAPPLAAEPLAALPLDALATRIVPPHPAARWRFEPDVPVYTLWVGNRFDAQFTGEDLQWRGEGVLLTRPVAEVQHAPLSAAGAAFLDACAQGETLAGASAAAHACAAATDLAALMHQLLLAGALRAEDA